MEELQDEVERLLRRLVLEDIKVVAVHLQVEGAEGMEAPRDVLRAVQGIFDGAENDGEKDTMLRGLPIPEAHQAQYQRILQPPLEENVEAIAVAGLPNVPGGLIVTEPVAVVQNAPPTAPAIQVASGFGRGIPNGVGNFAAGPGQVGVPAVGGFGGGQLGVGYAGYAGNAGYGYQGFHPMMVGHHGNPVVSGMGNVNVRPPGVPEIYPVANPAAVSRAQGLPTQAAATTSTYMYPGQVPQARAAASTYMHPHQNFQNQFAGTPQGFAAGNYFGGPGVGFQPSYAQQTPGMMDNKPFFVPVQREFRLHGTISDDAEKSIKYNDLCKQISDGRKKGYPETDLMAGLRRGISAGSVKTYMDAGTDMSLDDVLEFLKSHLKEQEPSDLFNQLSSLRQKSGHSAESFLLDAMKLRKLLTSGTDANGVCYDSRMAHSVFLHSIRTGLRNERIRTHMLPFLDQTKHHGDNVLINELNRAVAEERAREEKLAAEELDKKKGAKVEMVDSSVLSSFLAQMKAPQANMVSIDDPLAIIMKQLKENDNRMSVIQEENKNQMKVMQEQISELMKLDPDPKKLSWKKMGCEDCIKNKKAAFCTHCWKCGREGHKSRECQKHSN